MPKPSSDGVTALMPSRLTVDRQTVQGLSMYRPPSKRQREAQARKLEAMRRGVEGTHKA